jgi:hypothetical protein
MFTLKGTDKRLLLFSILVSLSFIFYPIFWCFLPGILILLCPFRKRINVVEMLGFVTALSLSFWISTSWIIKIADIPIQPFTYSVILSTLALSVLFRKRIVLGNIEFAREDRIVLSVLVIAVLLKFVPLFLVNAPPGNDMSMHTYLTHLIVKKGAIPSTFEPLLPIELYGSYALGFHYLAALSSLFSRMPVYKASLIVSCFSHAFFPLVTYTFLRRFSGTWEALIIALVASFICSLPQSLIGSGTNPTVLAIGLLVISSVWLVDIERPMSWIRRGVLAIILAAAPMTHAIPSLGYVYVVVPVVLFTMVSTLFKGRGESGHLYRNIVIVGIFVGLFLIPYLQSMEATLSQGEINWVRNWQGVAFLSSVKGVPFGLEKRLGGAFLILFALEKRLGSTFLLISSLGFLVVLLRRERSKFQFILYSLMLLLLIINWRYWILPFSYALYPDRVTILLVIPLAVFGTSFVSWILSQYGKKLYRTILIGGLLVTSSWFYYYSYLVPSIRFSAVTDADLKAFHWIEDNTEEGDVFLNNYGDAGIWIPGIILRSTVVIQSNPVYLDEFRELQLSLQPQYVYIGAKEAYKQHIFLEKEQFEAKPELYRKVYEDGGVVIFKALDPSALREYFWGLEVIRKKVEFNRNIMGY